jgi:hypothetical protein
MILDTHTLWPPSGGDTWEPSTYHRNQYKSESEILSYRHNGTIVHVIFDLFDSGAWKWDIYYYACSPTGSLGMGILRTLLQGTGSNTN